MLMTWNALHQCKARTTIFTLPNHQQQLFMTHQSLQRLLHSLQASQPPLAAASTRILIVTACKMHMHSQFALHMQPHLQSVPKLHVCNTTHLHCNNNNSLPNSCILQKKTPPTEYSYFFNSVITATTPECPTNSSTKASFTGQRLSGCQRPHPAVPMPAECSRG